MGAHEDDAALEARIGHAGQGDEQLAFQEALAFDRALRIVCDHAPR